MYTDLEQHGKWIDQGGVYIKPCQSVRSILSVSNLTQVISL